mgnify:CR=1 FL=1
MTGELGRKLNQERLLDKLCKAIKVFENHNPEDKLPISMLFYKKPSDSKNVKNLDFIRSALKLKGSYSVEALGDFNQFILSDSKNIKVSNNELLFEELRIETGNVTLMLNFREKLLKLR